MAATHAALKAFGGCHLQSSIHRQSSNVDASLDLQASTSGRLSAPFQSDSKARGSARTWSSWREHTPLTTKRELLLHAVGRKGRCQCKQAGLPWPYCRPLGQQRRDFLAWCIAALVGGQVGTACGSDLGAKAGAKAGALASSGVCQQPVVKGPVEVSVIPRWSGVDAGHIIEDGGYPPTVVAAPGRRVVASGDFHGDMRAARRALQLAGVLSQDQQDRWTGGSSVFVQVGDVLDRGDDEIAIMSLLAHLSRQASAAGGALYQVCGNHETMNVYGDFRYVTEEGFKEGDWFDRWARENYGGDHMAAFQSWYKEAPLAKQQLKRSPSASWNPLLANRPRRVRQELFEPGGPLARVMAGYSAVLQVNDSLFAHGGVLPHHVDYGLERLNREVSRWMLGHTDRITGEPQEQPFLATRGYNSVMWSRLYSREEYDSGAERDQVCMTLSKALRMVPGAKRLIVGHTPQETGANSECNGRIWRIDVGMSSGILQAAPQVLEISGSDVRVLSEETGRDLWLASYI